MKTIELTQKTNKDVFHDVLWTLYPFRKPLKSDERMHIQNVLVKDGKLYATDGSRIHSCNVPFKNGVYRVLKCVKSEILLAENESVGTDEFPDCKFQLDNSKTHESAFEMRLVPDAVDPLIAKISRRLYDQCVNHSFVIDVCRTNGDRDVWFDVYIPGDNLPVNFENHTKRAAIMPKTI